MSYRDRISKMLYESSEINPPQWLEYSILEFIMSQVRSKEIELLSSDKRKASDEEITRMFETTVSKFKEILNSIVNSSEK